jgi:hypothetical protein
VQEGSRRVGGPAHWLTSLNRGFSTYDSCAPGVIRTPDSWFRKPLLYPLSYGGDEVQPTYQRSLTGTRAHQPSPASTLAHTWMTRKINGWHMSSLGVVTRSRVHRIDAMRWAAGPGWRGQLRHPAYEVQPESGHWVAGGGEEFAVIDQLAVGIVEDPVRRDRAGYGSTFAR